MPKHFAPPPIPVTDGTNCHPEAACSDPLCDLLFGNAGLDAVADELRCRDEPNGRVVAEYLLLAVDSLPHFRRAIADGQGAVLKRIEAEDRLRRLETSRPETLTPDGITAHETMVASAAAESRRLATVEGVATHASCGLGQLATYAPALLRDSRSETLADEPADMDDVTRRRLAIVNFAVDHKVEMTRGVDGWPKTAREYFHDQPTVKLVNVQTPGLRIQ